MRTATAYGQYGAFTTTDDHNPVRPRKRKCDGQGEENHDSDSREGSIVRKARPVDKSKTSSSSDEIQIDHNQNMLQLPKGISSVTVTHPGPGQPIQIKLPLMKPKLNWCTIRINVPERMVTCPDSNVTLSVRALKKPRYWPKKEKPWFEFPSPIKEKFRASVFMPFPGWELMLLLGRSRPDEK